MIDNGPPLSPEAETRLREAKAYVKDNLNAQNQKVIEQDLWTPNKHYLDFSLCKDYTIGAAYYLLLKDPRFSDKKQEVITGIKEGIPKWQDRIWDDWDAHYPNLPIKAADIQAVIDDPTTHDQVFQLSPNTVFYVLLRDDLLANANHSHVRGKFTKIFVDDNQGGHHVRTYDPIIFTVNTYPLTLSMPVQELVGKYLANLMSVDIAIISRSPESFTYKDSWLKDIEQFYISRIGDWTKNPFIKDKIYESIGYLEKHMANIPVFDPRMSALCENNPAWFRKARFMARVLFDPAYRHTAKASDPRLLVDTVLNHLCLFIDLKWSPTIATRFTLPPEKETRTEELSEQVMTALSKFS